MFSPVFCRHICVFSPRNGQSSIPGLQSPATILFHENKETTVSYLSNAAFIPRRILPKAVGNSRTICPGPGALSVPTKADPSQIQAVLLAIKSLDPAVFLL